MNIYKSRGFECEKALPTTLEDLFNQSELEYEHAGESRKLTVVYVRYFDEYVREHGLYSAEETGVPFHDIIALLIYMKNGAFPHEKRLYFNETERFLQAFDPQDIPQAVEIVRSLPQTQSI